MVIAAERSEIETLNIHYIAKVESENRVCIYFTMLQRYFSNNIPR